MQIKKPQKISTVIFDWDGVLCDSLPIFYRLYKTNVSNVSFRKFKKITSERARGEKLLPGRLLRYKEDLLNARLFPGAKAALRFLNMHRIKIVIVSTNKSYIIRSILKRTDALRYVSGIYGSDFAVKKPNKQLLKVIEKKFSVRHPEMLYVGDDVLDILFVKASKIRSIFVTYGYTQKNALMIKLTKNGIKPKNLLGGPSRLLDRMRAIMHLL